MKGYLFDEDYTEKYLVTDLPVKKEYYVDEGFYVVDGTKVIYACPECGELVEESQLLKVTAFIPETDANEEILKREGIALEDDMLFEALACYEANLKSLELEEFAADEYLEDPDGLQYVVDFGSRQAVFDVVLEVDVNLLEEQGETRLYQMGDLFIVTEFHRVVGEFSSYEAAKGL